MIKFLIHHISLFKNLAKKKKIKNRPARMLQYLDKDQDQDYVTISKPFVLDDHT